MGSIISNYRNKYNKELCDRLIAKYINTLKQLNIGITFIVGKKLKTKTFKYKNENYPKYYIIINAPDGLSSNYNIINSGSITLNGTDIMAQFAFNRYQSISKIYKPLTDFYQIVSINLANNSNVEEAMHSIIIKIATLEGTVSV